VLSASDEVRAAIDAAGGAIRFDEFMRLALYGEHGFYSTTGRAGRRGDFITSPEVGPLFGTVLARWIESEHRRLGEPDDFTIIECGAGPGSLARAVLAAAPRWRNHYVAVEISERQVQQHPEGVVSLPMLPAVAVGSGVVIANELLDNIPFRLALFDGVWREAVVSIGRHGELVEATEAGDPTWSFLPETAPHGARVPIQDQARDWVTSARRSLLQGTVLVFDYCTACTAELVGQPWRSWLRTYRSHDRGVHYLRDPGSQDITAQVCVDQLPSPSSFESQNDFLQRFGVNDLVEEGRRAWAAAAARPDLAALTMRSRVREAEALLEASGLGMFGTIAWRVESGDIAAGR
jgi:SAM-dependent MidA family methyltransferase